MVGQLKENQERIVQAIEYDPKKAITFEGKPLPELEFDEDEEEEEKPSTTEKKKIFNLDKGINKEYRTLLEDKGVNLPSTILQELKNDNEIKKVKGKLKRSQDYIQRHSTKQGKPLTKLSKMEKKNTFFT